MWALNNPNAKKIIEDYERFGQEVPKGLTPPELNDVEWSLWRAFWDLSTDRQIGMAAGPIMWTSISRYAPSTGLGMQVFSSIIRAMDDAYLGHKSGEGKKFSREMMRR